jgi:hypothetical protein
MGLLAAATRTTSTEARNARGRLKLSRTMPPPFGVCSQEGAGLLLETVASLAYSFVSSSAC